jgi:flagellar hook-associated protein 1 FlgK
MSITGAVSNALSGLTASARSAEVIADNLANLMTESYGRREIVLRTAAIAGEGAGVRVAGVDRIVNQTAIGERRLANAGLGSAETEVAFHTRLEEAIGRPGEPGALTERIAALEAAIATAESLPSENARLSAIADAGTALARQINLISTEISTIRMTADREIAQTVDEINETLSQIADLNGEIRLHRGTGRDINALLDERQRLIDKVSQNIPIREIPREGGEVALYTTSGAALLEANTPATIGFTPSSIITPEMTVSNGALSGLTLNGDPISTSGARQPLGGGALGARFAVRDNLAPAAQTQIDALARDLIERFADPAVDPTLAPGDPGLFTDAGGAFDPADELGIASRISFSPLVDPAQGGALWRLRDGLGAVDPGPVGNGALISAYGDALARARLPASGDFGSASLSAVELSTAFLSMNAAKLQTAEADQAFASFQVTSYDSAILEDGVDSDAEIQKLMLVEQSYAANARLLQAADDMISILLGI